MKSILIITSFFPYPIDNGGSQGLYNIIDNLRTRYKVSMAFPQNKDNKASALKELSTLWPEVEFYPYPYVKQLMSWSFLWTKFLRVLNRKLNFSSQRRIVIDSLSDYRIHNSFLYSSFIKDVIRKSQPDLIEVNFYPNIDLVKILPSHIKRVFVHHEIRFVIIQRMLSSLKLNHLDEIRKNNQKSDELSSLNEYDAVITLTDVDKKVIQDSGVSVPAYVSPLAVKTESRKYVEWNGTLVFVGGYGHYPNREGIDWFLNKVANKIDWTKKPGVKLIIVGKEWPNSYNGVYGNGLQVECKGFVDDLSACIFGGIMIVPILTGSGMRMKILDASALSMPFISTYVGAEGLAFENMKSCIIADTEDEFAEGLSLLMDNVKVRKEIAEKANELFEERYSGLALSKLRSDIYEDIMK